MWENLELLLARMPSLPLLALFYVAMSIFFFCFPTLLRPRRKYRSQLLNDMIDGKKIARIAHRGGPRFTTENTIEAFKKTKDVSDCLEMDVCVTKDNVLVVHHDPKLDRTCGINRLISEYDYADLPRFQDKIKLDFGCKCYVQTKNEKIPTLSQVFTQFPDIPMDIELKTPTKQAQEQFAKLIHKHQRTDITIVGIRNSQNDRFREKNKDIFTFLNDASIHKMIFGYFTGLLPFMEFSDVSMQVPVYSQEFLDWNLERTQPKDHWKVKIAMLGIRFMGFVSVPLLWHFKRRGLLTMGWVCNTEQAIERAVWLGFQGIMTDDPFLLDKHLRETTKNQNKSM